MASNLALYNHPEAEAVEKQLVALSPRFADVLGRIMQPERLVRTIMVSLDRTPTLYECNRRSILMAAMSAACLGLEVDGVTGQAFLIPFNDRQEQTKRAQLVTGYKGYNTLGGRAGYAIRGAVVRDGDVFEYDLPEGAIIHRPKLGNTSRIIGAWARAVSHSLPAHVSVLSIDEIMAVKNKAPGGKKSDSPWNDPLIGFVAMSEKTAKRRLGRSMPLNLMQYAARMDEAVEEQGRAAWIDPERGVMMEDAVESPLPPTINVTPTMPPSQTGDFRVLPATLAETAEALRDWINSAETVMQVDARWNNRRSIAVRQQVRAASSEAYDILVDAYDKRRMSLQQAEETRG